MTPNTPTSIQFGIEITVIDKTDFSPVKTRHFFELCCESREVARKLVSGNVEHPHWLDGEVRIRIDYAHPVWKEDWELEKLASEAMARTSPTIEERLENAA